MSDHTPFVLHPRLAPNLTPAFYNWNAVYFIYCDGGSFSGNQDEPIHFNVSHMPLRPSPTLSLSPLPPPLHISPLRLSFSPPLLLSLSPPLLLSLSPPLLLSLSPPFLLSLSPCLRLSSPCLRLSFSPPLLLSPLRLSPYPTNPLSTSPPLLLSAFPPARLSTFLHFRLCLSTSLPLHLSASRRAVSSFSFSPSLVHHPFLSPSFPLPPILPPQGIPLYVRGRRVAELLLRVLMEKKGLDRADRVRGGRVAGGRVRLAA
ncbi:unnamed protein product [Closterium sp. Yama58-4]|nr:unnamed protein product [Closterium sp. Yama58-4]